VHFLFVYFYLVPGRRYLYNSKYVNRCKHASRKGTLKKKVSFACLHDYWCNNVYFYNKNEYAGLWLYIEILLISFWEALKTRVVNKLKY